MSHIVSTAWCLGRSLSDAELSPAERDWMLDAGSLTVRLRAFTENRITFHVRTNGWGVPTEEERQLLSLPKAEQAWLREIDWIHEGARWITARVVIPSTSFLEEGEQLKAVGERPIGEILFSDPGLQRSDFDIATLDSTHFYHALACQNLSNPPALLRARRSMFYFYGKPLLLSEVFLPAFLKAVLS